MTKGGIAQKILLNQMKRLFGVTGRDSDVINIGGLKFMPSEVERSA